MTPSARLAALGITLPPVAAPVAAYVPAVQHGDIITTSGQLPFISGRLAIAGTVGADVTDEEATEAARIACLNAIAAAASLAGGIDQITRILRVVVYVASTPDFTAQPQVANGASTLLGEVFGEQGSHARSAVGVAALPLGAPVEVELVAVVGKLASPTA